MRNRYQNKKIKVTTQDGAEFTGTADVFPSGYGLHEFDRAEEGIQLDDVIVFKSDIRRIEELPDTASDESLCRLIEVWTKETKTRYQCYDPIAENGDEVEYRVEVKDIWHIVTQVFIILQDFLIKLIKPVIQKKIF